jgi:DNA topoisomerase-2
MARRVSVQVGHQVILVRLRADNAFIIGWSTSIPSYNPVDIVANIRRLMNGEELVLMLPWWRGFKGTIKKVGEHRYDVTGTATKVNDTTIEITELPIHKWTANFKTELETMMGDKGEGTVKVSLGRWHLAVQFKCFAGLQRTSRQR